MRSLLVAVLLALVAPAYGQDEAARPAPTDEQKATGITDEAPEYAMIQPEQVKWQDGPPSLPPGAKIAVLEGDPSKEGYFAMRLQFPDGYKIPPHWHPNVERVTVISGTFNLGMGDVFDPAAAHALPTGSYTYMPSGMRHFASAKGETVVQITTLGPWAITYVNPSDDPRHTK